MKHKILTVVLVFFIGMNFSFATEEVPENEKLNYENPKSLKNDKDLSDVQQDQFKKDVKERKALKRMIKKNKKFKNKQNAFMPNKVNALVIVGFLIFLPGMILTLIGIALIPALVLVIVGGTLWVIGLVKMMKS